MMLGPAKSLLFTFLSYHSAALVVGAAVPHDSPSVSHGDAAVRSLEEKDDDHVSVRFESACNDCVDGVDSSVTFRLDISSTEAVCGEGNFLLNGQPLEFQWDAVDGIGEGNLTTELGDDLGSRDLYLSWRSLCVASPKDSIEEYAAQILAVTFFPSDQVQDAETSGFAVSFNSVDRPEIFKLVNSPVELPEEEDDDSFAEWLDTSDSPGLHLQQAIEDPVDVGLEADLKELESLKEQAARLNDMIKEKDYKIREHLLRDCASVTSRLRHCENLKCFIKTSLKIVPDTFRLMKYRFGPLPSSLSGSPCHSSTISDPMKNNTNSSNLESPSNSRVKGLNTTDTINSTTVISNFPQIPLPTLQQGTRIRYFIRNVVCALLVATVLILAVRYCRNTITCQRRRADLAARREERRTRVAYRRAALRYRWRQWWNSLFCQQQGGQHARPAQYSHMRPEARRTVGFATDTTTNNNAPVGDGTTMGAEILGLRRVLEYVGELVRYNDEPDSQIRRRSTQQDLGDIYVPRPTTPTPSSTAPLTTIGSPRTSSVMTYSSDSLDTANGSLDAETVTIVSG